MSEVDTLIEIYAGSYIEAWIILGVLETNEIRAFLKDQILGVEAPWYTAPGGVGAVKVLVPSKDYEVARSIIEAAPDRIHQAGY